MEKTATVVDNSVEARQINTIEYNVNKVVVVPAPKFVPGHNK